MRKFYEDSLSIAWINDKTDERISATRVNSGKYWHVDYCKKPGAGVKKLGTRCTWEQVLDFVNQH